METPNHNPEILSPEVDEVHEFLKRLWLNPLVDETTLRMREEAKKAFIDTTSSVGIPPTDYIAMVSGSLAGIGIPSEESDFDFKVIRLTDDETKFTEAMRPLARAGIEVFDGTKKLDESSLLRTDYSRLMGNLLLRPDNLIVGNLQRAHELRLLALEQIADDPASIEELWDAKNAPFRQQEVQGAQGSRIRTPYTIMMSWPDYATLDDDHKRPKRFKERLESFGDDTKRVDEVNFVRKGLGIPFFSTYLSALRQTKGALTL